MNDNLSINEQSKYSFLIRINKSIKHQIYIFPHLPYPQ